MGIRLGMGFCSGSANPILESSFRFAAIHFGDSQAPVFDAFRADERICYLANHAGLSAQHDNFKTIVVI